MAGETDKGERRIPYPLVWAVFLISLFLGAGLMLHPDPAWRGVGVLLLLAPVVAFGLLMLAYYVKSRRAA